MSAPNTEEVNVSGTGDESHIFGSHEVVDVSNAASNSSAPVTSEEVARQIKAAADPLTKQLEWLCDLMKELRQALPRRNEENFGLTQGPSRRHGSKFDTMVRSW